MCIYRCFYYYNIILYIKSLSIANLYVYIDYITDILASMAQEWKNKMWPYLGRYYV